MKLLPDLLAGLFLNCDASLLKPSSWMVEVVLRQSPYVAQAALKLMAVLLYEASKSWRLQAGATTPSFVFSLFCGLLPLWLRRA